MPLNDLIGRRWQKRCQWQGDPCTEDTERTVRGAGRSLIRKCMEWKTVSFDWNQARAFLITAEEGSLSAAARALGQTQPTLGRQVAALETHLGVTLFERVGRSLALTQAGLELLEHVRSMGAAAGRVSLAASGQAQAVEGLVSVTVTDVMAVYCLPPILGRLAEQAPGIEVDIVASSALRDLRRREADIAIRHVRPDEPDFVAQCVRESELHFYASSAWIARHGRPERVADLADAAFIGFDDTERMIARLREVGLPLTRSHVRLRATSALVVWELVRQGLGIAPMMAEIAAMTPGVERVLPDLAPIPVPTWVVTHRELHTSRRIRLVFDLLAAGLRAA